MEHDPYLKAKERMERFLGKKIEILHDLLLHRNPLAVLRDDHGNVSLIIYPDDVTVSVLKQNEDYIVILRIPEEVGKRLKLPQVITTVVPEDVIDNADPRDVVESFLAAVRFDLIEFFR